MSIYNVYTDGSVYPNPGPGGWAAVLLVDDKLSAVRQGAEGFTTNNRMELAAIIHGYTLIPPDMPGTIYSDSEICVRTVNEWAKIWAGNGWRRRTGKIKNLDLVRAVHAEALRCPKVTVQWVRGHCGLQWNEYADMLAGEARKSGGYTMHTETKIIEERDDNQITIDIGIPGITFVHVITGRMIDNNVPVDGRWTVVWTATGHRIHQVPFRTFHSAVHYLQRIQALPGLLDRIVNVFTGGEITKELSQTVRHAEAHAHECDASYPAGTIIPCENGPGIVDDDGETWRFLEGIPFLKSEINSEGRRCCVKCKGLLAHVW